MAQSLHPMRGQNPPVPSFLIQDDPDILPRYQTRSHSVDRRSCGLIFCMASPTLLSDPRKYGASCNAPISISVITTRQIEDRNLFTIGEAIQKVARVSVMTFDGSNPDYRARGFVLDYAYDGVPSTFSSGVAGTTWRKHLRFERRIFDLVQHLGCLACRQPKLLRRSIGFMVERSEDRQRAHWPAGIGPIWLSPRRAASKVWRWRSA